MIHPVPYRDISGDHASQGEPTAGRILAREVQLRRDTRSDGDCPTNQACDSRPVAAVAGCCPRWLVGLPGMSRRWIARAGRTRRCSIGSTGLPSRMAFEALAGSWSVNFS